MKEDGAKIVDEKKIWYDLIRVIQIYLGNFKHDNFTSATKFSCSLSQKQSITGKNFEIGLHLGLVLARQSFST